jgi:hypothetical protein
MLFTYRYKQRGAVMSEMVQVPRQLLEQLTRYLTEPEEPRVAVPGNGEWTRAMVEQLKREAAPYRGAIATGDLTAQHAGQLVSLEAIAEATGLSRREVSSHLASFSKAARRIFGQVVWPFRALQSSQGTSYMMQPEIAQWWLET